MKTIDQIRAADALSRVTELNSRSDKFKMRYRACVDRLGPAIVMNGIGQALATERAAAGPHPSNNDQHAHHELYTSLNNWLCRQEGGIYRSGKDLLEEIMDNDEDLYLRAQVEALAWLEWHKKCCRASFPKGQEDAE